MDKQQGAKPKCFGRTAAAQVDVSQPERKALSAYAGQEVLLLGWKAQRSEHGEYVVIRLKRHGAEAEDVTTGSDTVIRQLQAFASEDWQGGVIAWINQAKSKSGRPGRLWLSDAPAETALEDVVTPREHGPS